MGGRRRGALPGVHPVDRAARDGPSRPLPCAGASPPHVVPAHRRADDRVQRQPAGADRGGLLRAQRAHLGARDRVAGLSGLRAFYQWDQSWKLYRSQELALEALLTRWQLGMMLIVRSAPADADDQAHALTLGILNEAYESGRTELSDFFSVIAWPQKAG